MGLSVAQCLRNMEAVLGLSIKAERAESHRPHAPKWEAKS